MKYTKWLSAVGIMAICMALTACGHTHEWQEATCTSPKTCTTCNETEGEAQGHTWTEATCSAPKTCSVCGETEGDPLEHTLTEANYQQAATCEICGETVGEPLQADFEKYGLTEKLLELDKEYDCVIVCNDDSSRTTNAKIMFSNYQTFTSGIPETLKNIEINKKELPEESGYEYKSVNVTIKCSDENAKRYGARLSLCEEDYYDIVGHDGSTAYDEDGWQHFSVNWNGTDYTKCMEGAFGELNRNNDGTYSFNVAYIVRVPVGYDGHVMGFRNGQVEWEDGKYIFDLDNTDTVFFRFE